MNIVFWFLIILALISVWFMACALFNPLGKLLSHIFNDAVECLNTEDTKKENEGVNEE